MKCPSLEFYIIFLLFSFLEPLTKVRKNCILMTVCELDLCIELAFIFIFYRVEVTKVSWEFRLCCDKYNHRQFFKYIFCT